LSLHHSSFYARPFVPRLYSWQSIKNRLPFLNSISTEICRGRLFVLLRLNPLCREFARQRLIWRGAKWLENKSFHKTRGAMPIPWSSTAIIDCRR